MKIALLGPAYPLRGGIAQHTGALYKNLSSRGHEVTLFSFRRQFPGFLFPGKSQYDQSTAAFRPPVKPVFIPWNPASWFQTAEAVKRGGFDALVCVYWMPFTAPGYAAVCASVKRGSSTPIIFILHNVIPHEKMPGMKFLTRLTFKYAGGFIAQSGKVERELLEFFPPAEGKWRRVAPHPVYDFGEFASPTKEESKKRLGVTESRILLYFGLVRAYKGLKTLINALPKVRDSFGGDIRLIIAGEFYDSPEPYMELISRLGLADRVTVHNRFIPNEEVGSYFAAADVVVLPYSSASQSGVTQAAFGFGKPVISTEVGGLPETVAHGRTGLLCPPDNPEALSTTIIEFYRLSETVDWKSNIEAEKGRFSWDNFSRAIEDFVNSHSTVDG